MTEKIHLFKWSEVDSDLKSQIIQFPLDEWGHIPLILETNWATPSWSVILQSPKGEIISFLNIVERKALFDQSEKNIFGINNFITVKRYRGKGYGKKVLDFTHQFIKDTNNCDLGLLLCGDDVCKFYKSNGWTQSKADLFYKQKNSDLIKWSQHVFLYLKSKNIAVSHIDLNGLPW